MEEGNDDDYDQWVDNQVAEELKDLPNGMYKRNEEGKLVKVE